MKYFAPDYYHDFSCIAGECRHSCCAGWEIDIDEETLEKYLSMEGETGELLRRHIDTSGETACFKMTGDERCPFLNRDGLCDLILSEGDGILCQICTDHPRFRNFYQDREEIGLGLCCEAAVRLILTRQEPARLVLLEDDGWDDEPDEAEEALLEVRGQLIRIMQDRELTVGERIERMLGRLGIGMPDTDYVKWAEYLAGLERLEDTWAERLGEMKDAPEADESVLLTEEWETAFEQLTVCLLYRHVPAALQDGDVAGRVRMVVLFLRIIRRLCALHAALHGGISMDDAVELVRLYSSEIEYSDVNIDAVLAALEEEEQKEE
ncbi:MAG: flagellin lysine-N-methylase [Clostridia bacterium]|nr:flagellin lysine-N-methylase [Clostridia bacterium]